MSSKTFKLAVLFVDISGGRDLPQADWADQHIEILGVLSQSFRGRALSIDAMKILACFPDIDEACRAAVSIQRHMMENAGHAACISVHSGLCQVQGSSVFGDVVDAAEAMMEQANEGQILFSEALREDALEATIQGAELLGEFPDGALYLLPWGDPDTLILPAKQDARPEPKPEPKPEHEPGLEPEPEIKPGKDKKSKKDKGKDKAKQKEAAADSAPERAPVVPAPPQVSPRAPGLPLATVLQRPVEKTLISGLRGEQDGLTQQVATETARRPRIALYSGDRDIEIFPDSGVFHIGRDPAACDWAFARPIVSRLHLSIEFRGGGFVLQDCSANGSYVSFSGQREVHLKNSELVLKGSGVISLAVPARVDPELIIRFDVTRT